MIPQMPPGSAEHVPAGLSGLGYLGSLCGQKSVVYMSGEREERTCVHCGCIGVSSSTRRFLRARGLERMGEPVQRVGGRPLCPPGRVLGWRWAQRHLVEPQGGIRGITRKLMASLGRTNGDGEAWPGGPGRPNHPWSQTQPLHPGCASFPAGKRFEMPPRRFSPTSQTQP